MPIVAMTGPNEFKYFEDGRTPDRPENYTYYRPGEAPPEIQRLIDSGQPTMNALTGGGPGGSRNGRSSGGSPSSGRGPQGPYGQPGGSIGPPNRPGGGAGGPSSGPPSMGSSGSGGSPRYGQPGGTIGPPNQPGGSSGPSPSPGVGPGLPSSGSPGRSNGGRPGGPPSQVSPGMGPSRRGLSSPGPGMGPPSQGPTRAGTTPMGSLGGPGLGVSAPGPNSGPPSIGASQTGMSMGQTSSEVAQGPNEGNVAFFNQMRDWSQGDTKQSGPGQANARMGPDSTPGSGRSYGADNRAASARQAQNMGGQSGGRSNVYWDPIVGSWRMRN